MKIFKLLIILLSVMPAIFAQNAETAATEIAMLLNIPEINEPYKRVQEAELKNYPETKYSPDAIASVILSNKNEGLTGELIASATAGFYKINYSVVVTQQPSELGLLFIQVTYTDQVLGEEITIPETDMENINLMLSDSSNRGGLNSSFLVYAAEGSPISYTIGYASNPMPNEDEFNAMKYSLRIVVEQL